MHKGAILDVHIVRSSRIAIHAGRRADSAALSARRLPAGSNGRDDLAVTLWWFGLLVIVRTIWSSAGCGGQWSPRVILVSRRARIRAYSSVASSVAWNRIHTSAADHSVDCSAGRLRVRNMSVSNAWVPRRMRRSVWHGFRSKSRLRMIKFKQ
jgi:hypothetical protein